MFTSSLHITFCTTLLILTLVVAKSCPNWKDICVQGSWKDIDIDKLNTVRNRCINVTPVNLTPQHTLKRGHLHRSDFYEEWPTKSLKFTNGPHVIGLHFHCQDDKIINRIQINAFQDVSDCLQDLNVYNCKVQDIELGAFNGLNNMQSFSLASNQLKTLTIDQDKPLLAQYYNTTDTISAFDFPELEVLHLNNNKIDALDDLFFKHIPNLELLFLDNNSIKTISKNAFAHNSQLRTLSLIGNQLTSLESELLPPSLEELYIQSNKIMNLDVATMHLLLPKLSRLAVFVNIGNEEGWECIEVELFTGYLHTLHINISKPAVNCEPRNSNMSHIKRFLGFVPYLE